MRRLPTMLIGAMIMVLLLGALPAWAGETENIDMWVQINWLNAAQNEADKFMEENPGINITIMEAGDDYHTKIMLCVSSGEFPDIFSIDSPEVPMALDFVTPLSDEAVAYYQGVLTTGALELGLIDGQYYALPLQIPTYPIWIANNNVFTELGVEIPTNFDEMLAVAEDLILRNEDGTVERYPYYIQSAPGQWSGWFNWHYLLMNENDIISEDRKSVTLNNEHTREVLEFIQTLVENDYVLFDSSNSVSGMDYIRQGKAVMGEDGCWQGDALFASLDELDWKIVTPTVTTGADVDPLVQASGWVLCLNKDASSMAREFWEGILTEEFDLQKSADGTSGPLYQSAKDNDEYYTGEFWDDYFSYAEYAQPYPNLTFGMSIQVILGDMFEQVFYGADIDSAIQTASGQISEVLAKEGA